jgi:hypothetical protein
MSITPPVPVAVRVPSTLGVVMRTELWFPVALELTRKVPENPLVELGVKNNVPAPFFSNVPVPVNAPVIA